MPDNENASSAGADTPTEETAAEKPAETTPEVTAQAAAPSGPVEPEITENQVFVAIRNFAARFEHQLLSFVEGEIIDHRVGKSLRALGAPIKIVEKSAKELKGKL